MSVAAASGLARGNVPDSGVSARHAMTVPEADLKKTDAGLIPQGEGLFVLNARDASWIRSDERRAGHRFERGQEWAQLGFRMQVLMRGQRDGLRAKGRAIAR
jgi:hypothetical protein